MSEPFLAEIKIISWNFPPKGWAYCNGQLLPINQNQALFALLGTTYGGNGQTNFALPNFQGRAPMHVGNGHILGERGGETSHTVTSSEMPAHTHFVTASNSVGNTEDFGGHILASPNEQLYTTSPPTTNLYPPTITSVGGSQPHENMAPYLVFNFIIALQGIFPSRN